MFVWVFVVVVVVVVFQDRVSLCTSGCPGTHSVGQAGFELRNLPASASQVLGLQVCATTTWPYIYFNNSFFFRGEGPLKTSQDLIHFLEVCFIFTSTQRDEILWDKKGTMTGSGWKGFCKVPFE